MARIQETPRRSTATSASLRCQSSTVQQLLGALRQVSQTYLQQVIDNATGKRRIRVRGDALPSSVDALERTFKSVIAGEAKMRPEGAARYKVSSSAGQPGRPFLVIPYVMLMRREVTHSPQDGVYIAILFSEDLQTLWLTLNQGLGQYAQHGGLRAAKHRLRYAAERIGSDVRTPEGFAKAPADLGSKTPFAQNYEQGTILGKSYDLRSIDEEATRDLLDDFHALADVYDLMPAFAIRRPSALAEVDEGDEQRFQMAANALSSSIQLRQLPDVPRARPARPGAKTSVVDWPRDAAVAGQALAAAFHRCEASCSYELFLNSAGVHTYTEAHHLIPMSQQPRFELSLDVSANVVSLCPACHAKVHRGHDVVRLPILRALFGHRRERLGRVGFSLTFEDLMAMYRPRQKQ